MLPPDARNVRPPAQGGMLVARRQAALTTFAGHSSAVAITVVQAFVLVPLCLAALGAHLYGAWLGAAELLTWIQLFDAGIPGLVTQRVGAALGRDDIVSASQWSSTCLLVLLVIGGTLVSIGWMIAPVVAVWVGARPDEISQVTSCLRLGVVASGLLLVFNGILGISRGMQQPHVANVAQVAGVAVNLGTSLALLLAGWGLWALPIGLFARATVSLGGGAVFLGRLPSTRQWLLRPSRTMLVEVRTLGPSMAGASAGYLIAYNTEVFLVAFVLGPTSAAIYALTRRVVDGLRNLLDAFIVAVYGGFAHLVTAHDRGRARRVMDEVLWLRLAVATLCGAVALPTNHGFVALLFGPETFGGMWLSTAFVVQLIVSGQSYLSNTLLRAAGLIREGSRLLLAEALGRVAAVVGGLYLVGLTGAPWAATAISAIALLVNRRQLDEILPAADEIAPQRTNRAWLTPAAIVVAVIGLTLVWTPLSWLRLCVTAAVVGAIGSACLWLARPSGVGVGLRTR